VELARAPAPHRENWCPLRLADKAREGGIPRVFRPKRNDERAKAERFSEDAAGVECRASFVTGC